MAPRGHNGIAGEQLLAIVQRVERVRDEKREYADDEKAIFAEAKSNGFNTGAIRRLLKRREMKPHDLEEMEAIDDVYRHAVGMAKELPLFRAVGSMAVDTTARESVVAALTQLVPTNGEIVLTAGGRSVRMWRDEKGEAHTQDNWTPPSAGLDEDARPRPRAEARRAVPPAPEVDDEGAVELGREAARNNEAVVANPFPWDDGRRRLWDAGWREVAGSDGMGPDDD